MGMGMNTIMLDKEENVSNNETVGYLITEMMTGVCTFGRNRLEISEHVIRIPFPALDIMISVHRNSHWGNWKNIVKDPLHTSFSTFYVLIFFFQNKNFKK